MRAAGRAAALFQLTVDFSCPFIPTSWHLCPKHSGKQRKRLGVSLVTLFSTALTIAIYSKHARLDPSTTDLSGSFLEKPPTTPADVASCEQVTSAQSPNPKSSAAFFRLT